MLQKKLDIYFDTTCWTCRTAMIGEINTTDDGYEFFVGYCPECEPEEEQKGIRKNIQYLI